MTNKYISQINILFLSLFLFSGKWRPGKGEKRKMSELKETAENGMEVYSSKVHTCLEEYMRTRGIEDMTKECQNKWSAALRYVGKNVFKGTQKLKKPLKKATDGFMGYKNNNAYDLEKVNSLVDVYIDLCYEFDKEISVNGFSFMSGIDYDVLNNWAGRYKNSPGTQNGGELGRRIYQKLISQNEESLSGMLISGGKHPPVGVLGALNRKHGWNMGQPLNFQQPGGLPGKSAEEIAADHLVSGSDIPELPNLE